MKDMRRSQFHPKVLRQRNKKKTLDSQTEHTKFDKFNTAISTIIVVSTFLGIISIFINYYLAIAFLSALILEVLVALCGTMYFGFRENKEKDNVELGRLPVQIEKDISNTSLTLSDKEESIDFPQKEQSITQTSKDAETSIVLEYFDMLTGVQFKNLIEKYFKANGYRVNRISPRINNIDFLLEQDDNYIAIATKKTFDLIQRSYINNVIESAKMYDNITKIMIITTSLYFMPQARQLAGKNGIILWDREILKSKLGGQNEI